CVKSASRFPVPEGVVQPARNTMPAIRDNNASVGREAAWEVCESWVVMRMGKICSVAWLRSFTYFFVCQVHTHQPRPDMWLVTFCTSNVKTGPFAPETFVFVRQTFDCRELILRS